MRSIINGDDFDDGDDGKDDKSDDTNGTDDGGTTRWQKGKRNGKDVE